MEGFPGITGDLPRDSHAPAPFPSSRSGEGENKLEISGHALEIQEGKEGGRPPMPDKGTKRQRPATSCTMTKMRRHNDTSDLKTRSTSSAASPIVDASLYEVGSGREASAPSLGSEPSRSTDQEGSVRVRSLTPPLHSGHGQPGDDAASTRLEKAVLGGLAWSSECRCAFSA